MGRSSVQLIMPAASGRWLPQKDIGPGKTFELFGCGHTTKGMARAIRRGTSKLGLEKGKLRRGLSAAVNEEG